MCGESLAYYDCGHHAGVHRVPCPSDCRTYERRPKITYLAAWCHACEVAHAEIRWTATDINLELNNFHANIARRRMHNIRVLEMRNTNLRPAPFDGGQAMPGDRVVIKEAFKLDEKDMNRLGYTDTSINDEEYERDLRSPYYSSASRQEPPAAWTYARGTRRTVSDPTPNPVFQTPLRRASHASAPTNRPQSPVIVEHVDLTDRIQNNATRSGRRTFSSPSHATRQTQAGNARPAKYVVTATRRFVYSKPPATSGEETVRSEHSRKKEHATQAPKEEFLKSPIRKTTYHYDKTSASAYTRRGYR